MGDPKIKKYLAYRNEAANFLDKLLDKQQTELIELLTKLFEKVGDVLEATEQREAKLQELLKPMADHYKKHRIKMVCIDFNENIFVDYREIYRALQQDAEEGNSIE